MTAQGASGADEYVAIDVPADAEQLRLVRLVVSGLATSHGADVDDLEDLRIATGEICAHLVGRAGGDDRLEVTVTIRSDRTVRVGATVRGLTEPGSLDELSEMVLQTTTSRFGVDAVGAGTDAWFERAITAGSDAVGAPPADG